MVVKIERVLLLNGFVEIKEVEPHIVNVEHEQPGVNDFGDEPADHEIASENILKLLNNVSFETLLISKKNRFFIDVFE